MPTNTAQETLPTTSVSSTQQQVDTPIAVIDEHHLNQEHHENDHTTALAPKNQNTYIRIPKNMTERDKKVMLCYFLTVVPVYMIIFLAVALVLFPFLILCMIPSPYTVFFGVGGLLAGLLILLALWLLHCIVHMIISIVTALVYCCKQRRAQNHLLHHEEEEHHV